MSKATITVNVQALPVFTCSICGAEFSTQSALDAHTASVHPPEPVPTSLTLEVSNANPKVGELITFSGKLTRTDTGAGVGPNKTINLRGTPIDCGVYTNSSGYYSTSGYYTDAGARTVTAEFYGDADYAGCEESFGEGGEW